MMWAAVISSTKLLKQEKLGRQQLSPADVNLLGFQK